MKYGKQLQINSYEPWTDKYLAYGKIKRMLKRYNFVRMGRRKGEEDAELKFARKEAAWAAEAGLGANAAGSPQTQNLFKGKTSLPGDRAAATATATATSPLLEQQQQQQQQLGGEASGYNTGGAGAGEGRRATLAGGEKLSPMLRRTGSLASISNSKIADDHANFIRMKRQESAEQGVSSATEFFGIVDEELYKVEEFYKGKYAELDQILGGFESRGNLQNSWAVPSGNTLTPLFEAYTEITALVKFVEMNGEGFRKIVKKYDKTMGTSFLDSFLERLQKYDFYQSKAGEALLERVQGLVSRDKLLDMKRHAEMAHKDSAEKAIFPAVKFPPLVFSLLLFWLMLTFQPDLDGNSHASRCLTMLVFVTSLWVTEAMPYFVTALIIPVLVVLMDVMEDSSGHDKDRKKAAKTVLSHMVNHTTVLIMGGYAISAAFSRCEIELRIASLLQKRLGGRPRLFILGIMYLGLFLSTLISNHTAPVLCVSILMPVIRDFGVDSRFAKTLLLGLAFACNFGGMVTPISSMQNVVARQALENAGFAISFGTWVAVGLPFCALGVFIAWVLLCVVVNPCDVESIPMIVHSRGEVMSRKNIFIVALTLLTIFGWSTIGVTEDLFGDLGIIALIFIIIAFGSGILSEVDFNSFSWHTLFLLGGGNVLGKAISSSQLLDYLAHGIVNLLPKDNKFLLLVEVVSVTMCISTFVSHTVAALILMPIIVEVGVKCGNPVLLGMGAALAVSSGCALPFSSFPNVTALLVTDDYQRKYLVVKDFLTSGLPMSLASVGMICTLGYFLIVEIIIPVVVVTGDDDDNFKQASSGR
eukprot:g5464.t1